MTLYLHMQESNSSWPWPIHLAQYDLTTVLSKTEQLALNTLVDQPSSLLRRDLLQKLARLLQPLEAVMEYISPREARKSNSPFSNLRRVICLAMQQRQTAFWAWTGQEWQEILELDQKNLLPLHRRMIREVRPLILAVAYLVNPNIDVVALAAIARLQPVLVAQKVFGTDRVEGAIQKIETFLYTWGYRQNERFMVATCVGYLLLASRSPFLEDLTFELLEKTRQYCPLPSVQETLTRVSRALAGLRIIGQPLPNPKEGREVVSGLDGTVSGEWLSWCQRWRQQTTRPKESRNGVYYLLLKTGRWLNVHHPEITSPAQWTNELVVEFVAAVCEMKVGECAHPHRRQSQRYGQPLRPRAVHHFLGAMSVFLRDCQEWGWIPIRLNPQRVLRVPSSIRRLIGPDPRVMAC